MENNEMEKRGGFLFHSSGSGSPTEVISVVFRCAGSVGAFNGVHSLRKGILELQQEKTHNTNVEGLCLNIELSVLANTIYTPIHSCISPDKAPTLVLHFVG